MLRSLKNLFSSTPATSQPKAGAVPAGFEILVDEECPPTEEPQIAARFMGFLFSSSDDVTTLNIDGRRAECSNDELRQFLSLVAGSRNTATFVAQCKAIMFPSKEVGALGVLCCMYQERLYRFTVFEKSPHADPEWEIRRTVHEAQQGIPADAPASRGRG